MKLTKQTEAELLKAYYSFWESNLSADMEKFSSYLVDDFSIIGSANGEVFFSREDAVKFYTATADEMRGKAELRNRKVSAQPLDTNSAIVREESDLYVLIGNEWTFYGHARISCVIKNIDGVWKAVHQHASFPDHRTEADQQLASEKIEKENLELREAVKRRTVELESKNRELEIETALERVRARTMAMQYSTELSDVVYVLYKQMQQLGFDYGACTITLMNETTGDTDWWMAGFSDLEYPDCYHVNYFDHPGYKAVLKAWKQKEKFAAIEIKGASKRAYDNIIFTQTGFSKLADHIKTMMASLDSVIYSMAYMKYGALSFGPTAITDSQKHILQKFTEVFEQTYTRFLDLQKAEAQAREAEIELALERVRARAMAMQESDDLKSVVKELYEQLRQLGFKWGAASITIMDEATGDFDWWLEGFEDGYELPEKYHVPYFNHNGHNQQLEQWKAGSNYAVIEISGADKKLYDNYYFFQTDFSHAPERSKNLMMSQEAVIFSMAYTRYGALSWSPTKLDDQQAIVLQRMAKVFEQTYTRFLDLQKAEAQAREAQIEAALERVRSKTMAMQQSSQLREIVATILEQLQKLGFTYGACSIVIMDKLTGDMVWWISGFEKEYPASYHIPFFEHPFYLAQLSNWKEEKKYAVLETSGEEKKAYDKIIFSQTEFVKIPSETQMVMKGFEKIVFSNAYMKHGALSWSADYISDELASILQRFAGVFEQSYTRFLDLQKAEAQAREAQIESALEKIRSRSLAMHHSEELREVIAVFFEKLIELEVLLGTVGIALFDRQSKDIFSWVGNAIQSPQLVHAPYNEAMMQDENFMRDSWLAIEEKMEFVNKVYTKAQKNRYFEHLFSNNDLTRIPENAREMLSKMDNHTVCFFPNSHSALFVDSWDGKVYLDKDLNILRRAGRVFEQAYTRFLDLQKAEVQAREAKIEAALERVRSTSLAMHKSQDLSTVVYVVFSELVKLDAQLDRCLILTVNPQTLGITWYLAGKEGLLSNNGFLVPDNPHPSHQAYLNGWRTKRKRWQYLLGGEEKRQCDTYIFSQTELSHLPDFIKADMAAVEAIHLTISSDDFGCLIASSLAPLSDAHAGIVERFAVVFNQAYTRFLDLQKAEAQALRAEQDLIEIKLARKKAEDTLTELQLTQKQLIQSEKMASLGELTAGIAHEIQNPLNFVNNFSEVSTELVEEMKAELATGNQQLATEIANDLKQNLEKINHHGKRAGDIVKGMLQHSRTSSGQKELTDINALCDEYLRLSYHGLRAKDKSFNAKFETDFDSSLPKINVVPQEMGRVILNLINNAFYAVNEKAKRLPKDYEPTVIVSTRRELNKAIITVADNGDGIPAAIKDKIFQPFFTTKPTGQGTGLGLSLSYDIVKAHGGELKVETRDGEMTAFIITLL